MTNELDFAYPWWLSYGHLILAVVAVGLFVAVRRRTWWVVLFGALALWAVAAFAVTRFVLDFNGRGLMPTENFLRAGTGRVLDMGAGTGRSSIMVLEARPKVTLVASDQFGASYEQHFGGGVSPEERLRANFQAAGVADRATIQRADMRALPFGDGEFDGIVSAYAVDHLGNEGIGKALAEAARVVKPGGEFLLMLVAKDGWVKFTFGPILLHSHTRGPDWWTGRLEEAGFQVLEHGARPATLYLLSRKK